jgi:hypothetical protein
MKKPWAKDNLPHGVKQRAHAALYWLLKKYPEDTAKELIHQRFGVKV